MSAVYTLVEHQPAHSSNPKAFCFECCPSSGLNF
nr:MAG TPA: hypothetical protein [Caudoviricetes sp.]